VSWLILGVALVVGGVLVLRWFATADTATVIRVLRWTAVGLALLVVLFVILSGRLAWLWVAAMGLLPWLRRWRMLRRAMGAARGPASGRQSRVDTRFVAMTLDHDSGEMDGTVREGPFAGRQLSEMSLDDLIALYEAVCAVDSRSASVLESYLDRAHGEEWRDRVTQGGGAGGAGAGRAGAGRADGAEGAAFQTKMTRDEAYRILGLEPGAPAAEIRHSHHELMKKLHPDHGGSDYLAAKINEAKERLLDID